MMVMDEVEELIEKLQKGSAEERAEAARRLGRMKDERAVEPLIGKLGNLEVLEHLVFGQKYIVEALVEIGKPAVEPLIKALGNEDADVRSAAARTLEKIGDAKAVGPLIGLLRDRNADVRWNAASALGEIKDVNAVGPLIGALGDKDMGVQGRAVGALGKIKDARAVEPLIEVLGKTDKSNRATAAWALGEIKDVSAVEPLIVALEDDDKLVREFAARALGEIGKPAVEPLVELARDPEKKHLRREISGILRKIDGEMRKKPHDFGCRERKVMEAPPIPREFERLVLRDVPKARVTG